MTNNTKHTFEIKTNSVGQRILIVDNNFSDREYTDINRKDFDAVLYLTDYCSLIESQLKLLNPLLNNDFMFKPFFVNNYIRKKIIKNMADGICNSIEDQHLIEETYRINRRIEELNFKIVSHEPSFWDNNNILWGIARFYLTRGNEFPKNDFKAGSLKGYYRGLSEFLIKQKFISGDSRNNFIKKTLSDKKSKFIDVKLVDRINVCPVCQHTHILFSERCPRCSSANIKQFDMIHHFRCANISSEMSYLKEGRMICPKCNKELFHIGVDYDRPIGIYQCEECSLQFTQPEIECICTNCSKVSKINELATTDIYDYYFTPYGKTIYAENDSFVLDKDINQLEQCVTFNSFVDIIRYRISRIRKYNSNHFIKVYRINARFNMYYKELLINDICDFDSYATIALKNDTVYVLQENNTETVNEELLMEKLENIRQNGYKDVEIDYIVYTNNMTSDEFIKTIE